MSRTSLNVRRLFLMAGTILCLHARGIDVLAAAPPPPPICETTCASSSACDTECYENLMEYENGNAITCLEFGVYDESGFCCGDDFCNNDLEDGDSCASDCSLGLTSSAPPSCGNNVCDVGESHRNCPGDCPRYNNCGDGICDGPGVGGESYNNCALDCTYSDFCIPGNEETWSCDSGFDCRSNRCTWDPLAQECTDSWDCGPGFRCVGKGTTTYGYCVQLF